jgi:hypothetical protein
VLSRCRYRWAPVLGFVGWGCCCWGRVIVVLLCWGNSRNIRVVRKRHPAGVAVPLCYRRAKMGR